MLENLESIENTVIRMEHILSNCKVALDTDRYTWRHNCVINYIVSNVDPKFTVYSDLPGHTAPGGGSIPPELCVTTQKPDIVILNKHAKTISLFELTCPSEKIGHYRFLRGQAR